MKNPLNVTNNIGIIWVIVGFCIALFLIATSYRDSEEAVVLKSIAIAMLLIIGAVLTILVIVSIIP